MSYPSSFKIFFSTTLPTLTSFQQLTNPSFCNSIVFTSIQNGGGWGRGGLTRSPLAPKLASPSSAYTGCTSENLNVTALNNNHLSGYSYDAAGNLLNDGASNYVYDGENRMTSGAGVTYTYDGDGKRVKKSSGTLYWYGTGSDALDETDLSGNLTNEYVFFAGKRIARRDSANNFFYYFSDHLGTSRVLVQSGQTSPCYDADFYPYGGERPPVVNSCPQNYKFTSKERDSESNLDYFGARHNSSMLGRFMSLDPLGGQRLDPQTLNKYAYVRNNPLVLVDPTGLIVEWHDSKAKCKKGETTCRTSAQRAYEDRLKQLRESKNEKERKKGEELTKSYERLQESKAVFEVKNDRTPGQNEGEITYQGDNHFTINLHGNDLYGLTDNQRLAHEFEHGRQILDGELSFANYTGKWKAWARDRTDEAKGYVAGFEIERASPGQGAWLNSIQDAIDAGGARAAAVRLGRGDSPYQNLPQGPNNVDFQSPAIYRVPQ